MKRFRGGLVFKVHRLLYHSTLGLRVIKKKRRERKHLFGREKEDEDVHAVEQDDGKHDVLDEEVGLPLDLDPRYQKRRPPVLEHFLRAGSGFSV